jgi:hypothetical protein
MSACLVATPAGSRLPTAIRIGKAQPTVVSAPLDGNKIATCGLEQTTAAHEFSRLAAERCRIRGDPRDAYGPKELPPLKYTPTHR